MDEIGIFTPEQARSLWQDYMRRQQLTPQLSQNYPQRRPIDEPSPHRVFVKNTAAEVIPPYACLRVTGTAETGGRTALLVEKPTATTGEFVFNGPYEIPTLANVGVGWAYKYDIIVMLGDGTPPTAANVQYSPVVGSWTITETSGPFVVFGEHNAATDALIGRIGSSSTGAQRIWFTIVSVECVSPTEVILTVLPTYYTGGCTAAIPGEDSYGYVTVEDVCGTLPYYTAVWLVGKTGSATYMYPRTGYCVPLWLVDSICGSPSCA